KPGKSSYHMAGVHHPEVLTEGHHQLNNSIMAQDTIQHVELLGILLIMQFSGCLGHSTMDSIHLLILIIEKNQVVSILALDVKGAYPSVDLEVLYHELHLVGVPLALVDWLRRWYVGRRTKLT
ncbi:hypothetical protein GYMLUDRAFT_132863, partial [Collybiopsis luxurians FD-317 M1]